MANIPVADEPADGEYFDVLDGNLSTAAAQITTILLMLGALIAEGAQNFTQAQAGLALEAALKQDALNDLHTGVGYMKETSAQLGIAYSAMLEAQTANANALAHIINAPLPVQPPTV